MITRQHLPCPLIGLCNCELLRLVTGWVNRFANAGDTAVEIAGNTAYRVRYQSHSVNSFVNLAHLASLWADGVKWMEITTRTWFIFMSNC